VVVEHHLSINYRGLAHALCRSLEDCVRFAAGCCNCVSTVVLLRTLSGGRYLDPMPVRCFALGWFLANTVSID
jgi:hypothetical protein